MPRKARTIPWLGWRDVTVCIRPEKKHQDDRAYVLWYDPEAGETKRLSLRTTDEGEAQSRFAAFLIEGEAITKPRRVDELNVAQALDDYYTEHVTHVDDKGLPQCADPGRQKIAIRNLKAGLGEYLLRDIDIPKCRAYAKLRRSGEIGGDKYGHRKKGGDATVRRELNVLVAAANHARRFKRITLDKMPSIELPPDTVLTADEEAPYFTKDEIALLVDMADGELKWFIELAYWTGARRGSIEHLERRQVKWEQKRILLQKPEKKATKKRQPIVPILPQMERPLKAVWTASEGRKRLFSQIDFYKRFKTLCEELGFGNRSHPHLLRHSRATHLLQDGKASLYDVARLLGDTVETVERVYGHHSHECLAERLGGSDGRQLAL